MPLKSTLTVVDGHSLAFRSFYGTRMLRTYEVPSGYVNALYGFVNRLIRHFASAPTHFAVAFDVSRHSFRTEIYADYKGNRKETPPEFIPQVGLIKQFLDLCGMKYLSQENYEADDIIATLAKQASRENFENVQIISGDRDLVQLVDERVSLLFFTSKDPSGFVRYEPAKVLEDFGVLPAQYPEVAALVGENSDNLPGVPKVGIKTALALLREYGSLQGIWDSREAISGAVGKSIRENYDAAWRNRRLNRLVDDLELPCSLAELRLPQPGVDFSLTELESFMKEYRLGNLFNKLVESMTARSPEPEKFVPQTLF